MENKDSKFDSFFVFRYENLKQVEAIDAAASFHFPVTS